MAKPIGRERNQIRERMAGIMGPCHFIVQHKGKLAGDQRSSYW